jgi:activator of 2-hydroxyglutaryl-CoA dehydratase
MIVAGMDIGSITTETVLLRDGEIFTSVILPTGANSRKAAGSFRKS